MSNSSTNCGTALSTNFFATSVAPAYSRNSDFEHDDSGQEPPKERTLWQAVILQAIYDARCAPTNARNRRDKTKAIIWFSPTDKDFLLVCELAGMNPVQVLREARKSIKRSTVINRRIQHMKRLKRSKAKQASGQVRLKVNAASS